MKHTISQESQLRRKPNQLFSVVDDEVVILSVKDEEYLNLNKIGSYIWLQLEKTQSYSTLIENLCEEYEIDKTTCIHDTKTFLEELIEKDIIQIVHA